MKPLYKWALGGFSSMIIFEIIFLLIKIFAKKSWWWVGVPSIFFGFCIAIFSVVILGIWIGSREKPLVEAKPTEITEQVIDEMKRDKDDPDNFRIKNVGTRMFGDKKSPTPILILNGYGTEKKEKICVLINLNNSQRRIFLKNKFTDVEILDAGERLADKLSEEVVTKQMTTIDFLNRPIQQIETHSPVQKKEENTENKEEIKV